MLEFINKLTLLEQIVYSTMLITLIYQIGVWLGFSTIATHRHNGKPSTNTPLPAISVIVIIEEGAKWYVQEELVKLLDQQYDGPWEVVVVNDCAGVELSSTLEEMTVRYPMLTHTQLRKDPKFPHSRKIPLMIGIKKSKYENLLFADPSATPRSNKWLSIMARGFIGGDGVLGYTGFTKSTNGLIRASRLMNSMRWLKSAVNYRPYRGIYNNIGYTKDAFFNSRGFTHLRLATGEDDLFIQKIARKRNISIILNPLCSMEQTPYGGVMWWWNEQRYRTFSFRFYPQSVKISVLLELLTKSILLITIALSPFIALQWGGWEYGWTIGAGALVLRELIVWWSTRRVMRRLGEKGMMLSFLLYDIINPITESILSISRRAKVNGSLWK